MQAIPIFCASDENYAPFLCATMYSILENTRHTINFCILDGGIRDGSKELIKDSLKQFLNYSVEYIDMSSFGLSRFPDVRHYSINAFSRYFIPEIKPKLDRALYLDVDIIVKRDISKLFNHDLDGYPLGAILEDFYEGNYKYLKEEIYPEYDGGSNYFNSGVLLMDCKQIREQNYTDKLVNFTVDLFDKLSCPDQDIYNIVFANNFKILDYCFNFMPDHLDYLEKLHPTRAHEIKDTAVIIHYTGAKPWKHQSAASADFWSIYRKTKFYNIDVEFINKTLFPSSVESFIPRPQQVKKMEFLKNFFSITNNKEKTHKVITILGVKIKLRRKNLKNCLNNILKIEETVDIELPSNMEVSALDTSRNDSFAKSCLRLGKLNLGCGTTFHPDWVQLDFFSDNPKIFIHNLLNGIPCDDNILDVVYHSHVLEHFQKEDAVAFMKECYRVLKPNGIVRVAVPDLEQIAKIYLEKLSERNENDYNWIMIEMYDQCVRNHSGGEMLKYFQQKSIPNLDFVFSRIGSEGEGLLKNCKTWRPPQNVSPHQIGEFRLGGEIHQWMYDRFSLELLLKATGFRDFKIQNANTSDIENYNDYGFDYVSEKVRKPESIFVEAKK